MRRAGVTLAACFWLFPAILAANEPDITSDEFLSECAPRVHPSTMRAVIQTESAGNPYAININGETRLVRQPENIEEAIATAQWLLDHGFNIDAGLAQINSQNYEWLGLSADTVFDACTNLGAADQVLTEAYLSATRRSVHNPLDTALSRYNTGNDTRGLSNGYVAKVRKHANAAPLATTTGY